jgi:hypothetical protein
MLEPIYKRALFPFLQCNEKNTIYEQLGYFMGKKTTLSFPLNEITTEMIHLFNTCVSLLRYKEVTRCCVLWTKYWNMDIVMTSNGEWREARKKQWEQIRYLNPFVIEQFLTIDEYVVEKWYTMLEKKDLQKQLTEMEFFSSIYHHVQ